MGLGNNFVPQDEVEAVRLLMITVSFDKKFRRVVLDFMNVKRLRKYRIEKYIFLSLFNIEPFYVVTNR